MEPPRPTRGKTEGVARGSFVGVEMPTAMRTYLDNVIVSGRIRADLDSVEMTAIQQLQRLAERGRLQLVTSRESWREQERTQDLGVRTALHEQRGDVPVVHDDHRLLGFSSLQDQYGGFVANPLVTDVVNEALFAALTAAGLKSADARHLMYAASNGCQRFVTSDPDFIGRRSVLEARCQELRIVKPSELAAELSQPLAGSADTQEP